MKSLLAAAAILSALSVPAFAAECPTLIQQAEEQLTMSKQDDAAKQKITDHIIQAKAEHEAGKHAESVATAKDALSLVKM
jgi:opacity protein-like surface antigen